MNELYGMRLVISPALDSMPRMRLSEKARAILTPEFAASMDQWMLEFFGTESIAIALPGSVIAVGPKTYAAVRQQAREVP